MTLFLSHSSSDADLVRALAADLEASGRQIWLDHDLVGGDAWWGRILKEIRECKVFVFAVSPNSLASDPCTAEFEYAKALGLPILSIEIADIPNEERRNYAVYAEQIVDYRTPTVMTAMSLVRALQEREAARKPLPDPLPPEPAMPYGYLLSLGTAIRGRDAIGYGDQHAILGQLKAALRAERSDSVRLSIRSLIVSLRDRADAAHTVVMEIDSFLGPTASETEEDRTAEFSSSPAGRLEEPPRPSPALDPDATQPQGSARDSTALAASSTQTAGRTAAPEPATTTQEESSSSSVVSRPAEADPPDAPRDDRVSTGSRATRRLLFTIGAISIAAGVTYLILHLTAEYHPDDGGYYVWPEAVEPALRATYGLALAGLIVGLGFSAARTRVLRGWCFATGGLFAAWALSFAILQLTSSWEILQVLGSTLGITFVAMGVLSVVLLRETLPVRWRLAVAAAWVVAGMIFFLLWLIAAVFLPYEPLPYLALFGVPELIIGAVVLPASFKVRMVDPSDSTAAEDGEDPGRQEDIRAVSAP